MCTYKEQVQNANLHLLSKRCSKSLYLIKILLCVYVSWWKLDGGGSWGGSELCTPQMINVSTLTNHPLLKSQSANNTHCRVPPLWSSLRTVLCEYPIGRGTVCTLHSWIKALARSLPVPLSLLGQGIQCCFLQVQLLLHRCHANHPLFF